ncbi:DJ-1/PfpI family protein [Gallaecimonas mangrovi]|uniref:DJ-1/PfpI family protein n=1 Tax=Gallaecimonas mangrovi TaxID=2291597 RepID=UPI000E20500B|nr:DJ-1/PfpI family protein [Gallaecimonas mangrovi]
MNIGIYVYEQAEVLDFSGPFEVFSTAKRVGAKDWNVFLIGQSTELVNARGGYWVKPHYAITDHPKLDALVVAGGVHSAEVKKPEVIDWIRQVDKTALKVTSVCTGAFLLAEAGLLDGHSVTTHSEDIPHLRADYPALDVVLDKRWVASGKYITSGGISAGIDMSLYLVSMLQGQELAEATAHQMEYRWYY